MCGIAGILDLESRTPRLELEHSARTMAATLRHRGPDGAGCWVDPESGIALTHQRLAILDLSPAGNQPMHSQSGRYVIALNGEIYNHRELKKELFAVHSGLRFRGHSDTEVLLAGFEHWGLEPALRRAQGMFALALWDRKEHILYLARDRFGEKPLYFARAGTRFIFGSELKALCAFQDLQPKIDRDALGLYFQFNCVPAPRTIFKGISKLEPASWLRASANGISRPSCYWSLPDVAERGAARPFTGTEAEAVEELDFLMRQSVAREMVADVPIGAFLSGGIDSSTIVAVMARENPDRIKTFSIGLHDPNYDESASARQVAAYLGTDHTELFVEPGEAMSLIPGLCAIYDEPFSDSAQIPQLLLSRLARQHVTVALSGDGGDEVFCGYNRYAWTPRIWKMVGWMPEAARRALSQLMTASSAQSWNNAFLCVSSILPGSLQHRLLGDKLHKLAPLLDSNNLSDLYLRLASHWNSTELLIDGSQSAENFRGFPGSQTIPIPLAMALHDSLTFLPDDVLTKVDRASMACGLEVRAPLLDHRLAEFAWRLPLEMKIKGRTGKRILRKLLARYVPAKLWERPKMGFGIPLAEWLRGPMRSWAEELLSDSRLRSDGWLNAGRVTEKWTEHLSRRHDWQYHLWDVLMFQCWLDDFKDKSSSTPLEIAVHA